MGDTTSHETEEKPSSRLPLSDKKSQGQLTHSSYNTEKNSNKSLEKGKNTPKMSHSLDHPGSPDCLPVPPHPKSQSLEVKSSNSSQQTGTAGSSAISAVGGAESSNSIGSSPDTQEFTLPGTAASVAEEPQSMVNRASGSLGTSAGNGPVQSNQEASDAPAFGRPSNPINSDLVTSGVSAASNMSPQLDQAGSNHSYAPQQPNASNSNTSTNRVSASHTSPQADQISATISSAARGSETPEGAESGTDGSNVSQQPNASNSDISTNRVSASHTSPQADQTSATISLAARRSETPEGAASGTDGSNVSQQPNASSSAVSPGEGENHHQSLTPSPVQVEPEGEVEDSSSDEGRPQEVEAVNNYETFKGEYWWFKDHAY